MRRRLAVLRNLGVISSVGTIVLIACAALWTTWLVQELSSPLSITGHHDFFALYSAATLVHTHQPQVLYDPATITALERRIFPHPTGYAGYLPFLNPPPAAALLAPLAALDESTARIVWLAVTLVCAALCTLLLTAGLAARVRLLALLVVLGTFPAYQTLIEGQWSYLMLLGALGALGLARRNHAWLAGAALVAFWLKPPLLLLVIVWLLLTRRWRLAGGAVAAVLAVTLITLPWTGISTDLDYLGYLVNVSAAHAGGGGAAGTTAWEGAFANMEGLLGLAAAIVGQQHPLAVDILTGILAAATLGLLAYGMRGRWTQRPLPLRLSIAALLAGLLLDPHLYAQDCVLLLIPAALALQSLGSVQLRGVLTMLRAAPTSVEAAVLVAAGLLMNLAAIDTLWSQGAFPLPLHALTMLMLLAVFSLCRQRRGTAV